jgi:hypothetical protein
MIEELVAKVFRTRNQAHLSHWKTKSYAEHQALGSFYDDIIDTTDKLVEACQGSKGIIGHVDLSCKDESIDIINFFQKNHHDKSFKVTFTRYSFLGYLSFNSFSKLRFSI